MRLPGRHIVLFVIVLVIGVASSARATLMNFTFAGTITGFTGQQTVNGVTGPLQTLGGQVLTFAVGDPFTGTAFFDTVPSGFGEIGAGIDIDVGGQHFIGLVPNQQASFDSGVFTINFDASDFASSNPFGLVDNFGGLSASFASGGSFSFSGLSGDSDLPNIKSFQLTGDITSFQDAPESGNCCLLFAISLLFLGILRRKMAQRSL